MVGPQNDSMVIKMDMANFTAYKMLVDNGNSVHVIVMDVLRKMDLVATCINLTYTPLVGFGKIGD